MIRRESHSYNMPVQVNYVIYFVEFIGYRLVVHPISIEVQ